MNDASQPFGDDLAQRGWSWATLETIADVVGGVTKNQRLAQGRDVPYLRVANVQRGHLDLSVVKTILATEAAIAELRLLPGDILLNEGGDRDKLGRGWVWEGQIPECIHQNHVFRARLRVPWISAKFVSYYTNSVGQAYFTDEGKQTTNLASISLSKIRRLPVAVPPASEQRRIVEELEKQFTRLDEAVATLKAVQAKLKRARASVLKAAVEGRLVPTEAELARAEGRSYEPASALLERILAERRARWPKGKKYQPPAEPKTDDLPELPEGWAWAALPQLGELDRGRSRHRPRNDARLLGGRYPFIQTGDIRGSSGTIHSWTATYSEFGLAQSRLWPAGTLCITIAANIAETGILAFDACFPDSVVGFLSSGSSLLTQFVEFFLRTQRRRLEALAPATAQKNINLATLGLLTVPLPPEREAERIVVELDRRLSVIDNLEHTVERTLAHCGRLRQSILKRAFEGRLVPQDPADEPASRLLERIRARAPRTDPRESRRTVSGARAAASAGAGRRR